MKTNLLSLAVLPVILVSCIGTSQPLPPKPQFREPVAAQKSKIYRPKGEWTIRSEDDVRQLEKLGAKISKKGGTLYVNLNGITLDGKNQRGDGGQGERQTPLFRAYTPLVIENGFIRNNKNAATFYKPNSAMKKVTYDDIGEDAVATADGAKNFLLQDCEFSGAADKSIQLNEASGAKVIGNTVHGGITGARLGKYDYSSKNDKAECSRNTFIGVDTAWNVGEIQLTVTSKNKYQGVKTPFKATKGAKIKNADGNVTRE